MVAPGASTNVHVCLNKVISAESSWWGPGDQLITTAHATHDCQCTTCAKSQARIALSNDISDNEEMPGRLPLKCNRAWSSLSPALLPAQWVGSAARTCHAVSLTSFLQTHDLHSLNKAGVMTAQAKNMQLSPPCFAIGKMSRCPFDGIVPEEATTRA